MTSLTSTAGSRIIPHAHLKEPVTETEGTNKMLEYGHRRLVVHKTLTTRLPLEWGCVCYVFQYIRCHRTRSPQSWPTLRHSRTELMTYDDWNDAVMSKWFDHQAFNSFMGTSYKKKSLLGKLLCYIGMLSLWCKQLCQTYSLCFLPGVDLCFW